jgi:adenosylmethionine-8-amino-7-oxononanoate aminotransferase
MYSETVGRAIVADGGPNSGHTFTGHTLACAAAVAVQEIVIRDRLVERVRIQGEAILDMLHEDLDSFDAVGDIRGRGHFVGVELVADRAARTAFDPALQLTEVIRHRTLEAGLICYPVSGTIDGVNGDVVIISPPYNASVAELEEIVSKLAAGLKLALRDVEAA